MWSEHSNCTELHLRNLVGVLCLYLPFRACFPGFLCLFSTGFTNIDIDCMWEFYTYGFCTICFAQSWSSKLYFSPRVSIIHDFISPYFQNTTVVQHFYVRSSLPETQLQTVIPILAPQCTLSLLSFCRCLNFNIQVYISGYSTYCLLCFYAWLTKWLWDAFSCGSVLFFVFEQLVISFPCLLSQRYVFNILNI